MMGAIVLSQQLAQDAFNSWNKEAIELNTINRKKIKEVLTSEIR